MTCRGQDLVSRLDRRAQEFICALNRKGAFARPLSVRNGCVPMMRARASGVATIAECPQSIWTKFVAMGLVASRRAGGEWQLTNFGKDVAKSAAAQFRKPATKAKPLIKAGQAGGPLRRNGQESPLAWLAQRKSRDGKPMISAAQFQAGERLRHDFFRAHLNPNVTMDWSMALSASGGGRRGGSDRVMINDVAIAARARVNAALGAVGPELGNILIDVCCHLKGLEASEQKAGWPRRSGKVILELALTRLARHYGLVSDGRASGTPSTRAIQHWGGEGYRPQMDAEPETESSDE